MKIRAKILDALGKLPSGPDQFMTAMELKKATGVRLSSLSPALLRLMKGGSILRKAGVGPRGGFGYRLKTIFETVTQAIQDQAVKDICEEMDQRVLADLMATSCWRS